MSQQIFVRRDTRAWVFQVWASFIIAALMCGYGVLNIPVGETERALLATAIFFTLSSSFVLAKCIRDNQMENVDTPMWRMQVWIAFAISLLLTIWGFSTIQIENWQRAFMLCSGLFLVSATFTLSKTVRDAHDADLVEQGGGKSGE